LRYGPGLGHKIGYARVSTADQNPQAQLDALAGEDCLKTYTDHASGTKADRPQWQACLADLRPGDTLIIWKIDRLGRNLRDLIDIVSTLAARVRHLRADGRNTKPRSTPNAPPQGWPPPVPAAAGAAAPPR